MGKIISFELSDDFSDEQIGEIQDTLEYVLSKEFDILWNEEKNCFVEVIYDNDDYDEDDK